MYLKAIQMKGFKSFPGKTRLEFGPGVSVVVGPNGSGKSNIADAIVWALGEQSPGAVRGGQMQDLLFGGAEGVPSAATAEVELVFDNSDHTLQSDFAELSVTRKLSRDGEGEYRINGARCRLVDVIEVLSDTGLGKEMHSVLSQGKVDEVVGSKPRDRRLLIEEAAGLGKHRKRRRRAQLKVEKTRDNLDRLLDVEREARSRLKPLKRQADAAETHERLEHQSNELRAEQAADRLLTATSDLDDAVRLASQARAARAQTEVQLAAVALDREQAERRIAAEAARREQLTESLYSVRSACERLAGARDRAAENVDRLAAEIDRGQGELSQMQLDVTPDVDDTRIQQLETDLAEIERQGRAELEGELAEMRAKLEASRAELSELSEDVTVSRAETTQVEAAAAAARRSVNEAQQTAAAARKERARIDGSLAAVDQFLREAASSNGADALAQHLAVEPGYELAVAAVLGRRLRAAVVEDLRAGQRSLDDAGDHGGSVLLADCVRTAANGAAGPVGALRLAEKLRGPDRSVSLIDSLLDDVWVVESLDSLPREFAGVAVTVSGRVLFAATGELFQAPATGEQRLLSERNRREALSGELDRARAVESVALEAITAAEVTASSLETDRQTTQDTARAKRIARDELSGSVEGLQRAIARRVEAGLADGPTAVRRAAIEAELRSERLHTESLARAADHQRRRRIELGRRLANTRAALPFAGQLAAALAEAEAIASERILVLAAALEGDRATGEQIAAQSRGYATREAELHAAIREQGETVTTAEVTAQRARDIHVESTAVATELSQALGRELATPESPLDASRREEIAVNLARIARRRELLGPVNPLAQDEYAEALDHVEELESQRNDLESALKELGDLIREIDKTIRTSFEDTFSATSTHFEDLLARLFPGGSGRLNLVQEERLKSAPLTAAGTDQAEADAAEDALPEDPEAHDDGEIEYGVEIEVKLPGAKSSRRLSLLSGGERSLVALAFLFSVFLTRPCPFYVFDEAEAALDDVNIDRLVSLLREHSAHSQFIVITHQKRTMDAADCLYGVSMGADGISKVVTRRLQGRPIEGAEQSELAVA